MFSLSNPQKFSASKTTRYTVLHVYCSYNTGRVLKEYMHVHVRMKIACKCCTTKLLIVYYKKILHGIVQNDKLSSNEFESFCLYLSENEPTHIARRGTGNAITL